MYLLLISSVLALSLLEEKKKLDSDLVLIVTFSILTILTSIRYYIGYDYIRYVEIVDNLPLYGIKIKKEFFSYMLLLFANKTHFQLYFILSSFVILVPIYLFVKEESLDPVFSTFIFMLFPMFYLNSWSIIRNFSAVSIVFYSQKYIFEKDFKSFMIIIIVASLFHISALASIPLYFIYDKKIPLSTFIYSSAIFYFLLKIIEKYKFILPNKLQLYLKPSKIIAGTKTLPVLLLIAVIIIIVMHILKQNKGLIISLTKETYYLNVLLIGIIFYIITFKFGTISYRLSLFYYIQIVILIPNILKKTQLSLAWPKEKYLFYKYVIILLFVPMFLYMISNNSDYTPFRTIFDSVF